MREPRVWPVALMPVVAGGAAVLLMWWVFTRPVEPVRTNVAVTRAEGVAAPQDMTVLARERLECDRQVALLMATKDPVELERAKYLINKLDCGIGRRLPPP
jgi:hypothetical protein